MVYIKDYNLSLRPRLRVPVSPSCVHRETSVCHLILCAKYIYLYNELVKLYNKYHLLTLVNVLMNMSEQCIYYIYELIFVNVG